MTVRKAKRPASSSKGAPSGRPERSATRRTASGQPFAKVPRKAPAKGSRARPALETEPVLRARAKKILAGLKRAYPGATIALHFKTPLDLYVATVLSAQCTDERVNQVTPALFALCREPEDYLALGQEKLEEMIRSTGFFRNKSKSILAGSRVMIEKFGDKVPGTMEELVQIPGIGRKTANVILGNAFDTPGITVDTHVGRVSRRLELTLEEDPVKVEFALQKLIPQKDWTFFSHAMIRHGRICCQARRPFCERCPIAAWCPYPAKMSGGTAVRMRPRRRATRT
jgi:endonuclease-3